ncbi:MULTISPECIES: hypothetical protein [unclassified Oceanobacillus]|uniref:hypothetical protein n=1 Tax=unclassified Oceanobacillus TaxID=2630292 RepID=UPI001BE92718|nr:MULTISPECIES: hypothetical protein [unclassified Oceanobacillus]MBT2600598.1 hypothetical protein [Oceanobacillus sp. ISL-74]MBT2651005.1 hypothetical protein [Oceanobacillus sp. ISL-73]
MKKMMLLLTLLLSVVIGVATPSYAASDIEPGYEIKFNLDLDAFSSTIDMLNIFDAEHDEDLKVYYFDTPDQEFRQLGYIHRLRVYASGKKTNITYKKRFTGVAVEDAIAEATEKGFHNDMSNYKFENDRKERIDVFSISRKEKFTKDDILRFDLIDPQYAIELFQDEAPKKYRRWDDEIWYRETLSNTIPYGPALAHTYEGEFLGFEADVEIWSYKGDTVTEISTKTDDPREADQIEAAWFNKLSKEGWLSDNQTSKTGFVMDR